MWNVSPSGAKHYSLPVEIYPLAICVREILERGYRRIQILSESQAAIETLATYCISSQLIWDSHWNLVLLAKSNKVTVVRVQDYNGIAGNDLADALVGGRICKCIYCARTSVCVELLRSPPMVSFVTGLRENNRRDGHIWRGIDPAILRCIKHSYCLHLTYWDKADQKSEWWRV